MVILDISSRNTHLHQMVSADVSSSNAYENANSRNLASTHCTLIYPTKDFQGYQTPYPPFKSLGIPIAISYPWHWTMFHALT